MQNKVHPLTHESSTQSAAGQTGRGGHGRPARRVRERVAMLLAAAALLGACGGVNEYQYLSDKTSGVVVQVPSEWRILEGDEILKVTAGRLPEADTAVFSRWLYGFSGDSTATGETLLTPGSAEPGGIIRSRYLLQGEVSTPAGLSVKNLFNSINDMAILPAEGQIMSYEGFGVITESGVNGVGYDVVIKFSTGDMKLTYIVTVDPRVGQLNTLLVGCSTGCYDANTQQIQKLVKSFTVVDPSSLRGA
jgi:hypothetical protein